MTPSTFRNSSFLAAAMLAAACSDAPGQTSPQESPEPSAGGAAGTPSNMNMQQPSAGSAGSAVQDMPEASTSGAGGGPSTDGGAAMPGRDAAATPSGPSAGCGKDVQDDPTKWIQHDLMVKVDAAYAATHTNRKYYTRVPKNYDPNKPYPVTFWGHGCGASGAENTPLMGGGANDNSIQVFLLAIGGCFSTSKANSPEIPYFDDALAGIEANYCVEKSKVFVAGYSSGGWLSYLLGCQRAGVIRGIGAASGGFQVDHGECSGPVAAILTADTTDMTNAIVNIDKTTGIDKGTGAGRDNILMRNGCGKETKPWDVGEKTFDASSCVEYQGCLPGYSVVWCQTTGRGHSNGADTGISTKGFWTYWSSLP